MSSRDYLKHFVGGTSTSARATNPGDEYWDPVANKLYKTVLINGTTTNRSEIALVGGSPTFSTINITGSLILQRYTVNTLPIAGVVGRIAYVTDAVSPTYLGTLTGGGTITTPVFDNGVAWVSH